MGKIFNKRELDLNPNETSIEICDNSWEIKMKTLMCNLIGESVEKRKFGCPPEMRSNSPFQLDALMSESFPEKIISTANILVDMRSI